MHVDPKVTGTIAIAGGAIALLAIAAAKGGTTGQGVVFQKPDPASVAAVENAGAAEIAAANQATADRMKTASSVIMGLAGLNEQLQLGALAQQQAMHQSDNAVQQVALQVSGQNYAADRTFQTAEYADAAATAAATLSHDAQVRAAELANQLGMHQADVHLQETQAQADAQTQQTNITQSKAVTIAQASAGASKTNGFWSTVGSIFSAFKHL